MESCSLRKLLFQTVKIFLDLLPLASMVLPAYLLRLDHRSLGLDLAILLVQERTLLLAEALHPLTGFLLLLCGSCL